MCGGPVRKATGGMIKSAAPKSVSKSAASAKQLPTPEFTPKRQVQPLPPKSVAKPSDLGSKRFIDQTRPEPVREAPRPTMEPKRQVQPTPPKDVRTIGGAPKNAKTMGGEPRRSDEGISAKRRLVGTAGDYAAPPEDVRTIGGAPKAPKNVGREAVRPAPEKAMATLRGMSAAPEKAAATPRGMSAAPEKAMVAPRGMGAAKTMGSVSPAAKRGVPVASNKPMIGFKTGGHVTKSSFKW